GPRPGREPSDLSRFCGGGDAVRHPGHEPLHGGGEQGDPPLQPAHPLFELPLLRGQPVAGGHLVLGYLAHLVLLVGRRRPAGRSRPRNRAREGARGRRSRGGAPERGSSGPPSTAPTALPPPSSEVEAVSEGAFPLHSHRPGAVRTVPGGPSEGDLRTGRPGGRVRAGKGGTGEAAAVPGATRPCGAERAGDPPPDGRAGPAGGSRR